jgi:hypothetical protein
MHPIKSVDHPTASSFRRPLCSMALDAWLADVAQAGGPKAGFLEISFFMMQNSFLPDKRARSGSMLTTLYGVADLPLYSSTSWLMT